MLTRLTITGADDRVNPDDLVALSREFPFVEWGVLLSGSRFGTPRYPSRDWLGRLGLAGLAKFAGCHVALSAHFCGDFARSVLADDINYIAGVIPYGFQRVQINGFRPMDSFDRVLQRHKESVEIILQVRAEADLQDAADLVAKVGGGASVLFDPSGGRGIESFSWPRPPAALQGRMGFAGGIKPHTIVDVLNDIGPLDSDFWLDMESGVRSGDDAFDLSLVRKALEAAAPFVREASL